MRAERNTHIFRFHYYHWCIKKNDLIRKIFDIFHVYLFRVFFLAIQPQIICIKYALHYPYSLLCEYISRLTCCSFCDDIATPIYFSPTPYALSCCCGGFFYIPDKLWLPAILNANAIRCFLDCCRCGAEKNTLIYNIQLWYSTINQIRFQCLV